jgi:hypothetical protein
MVTPECKQVLVLGAAPDAGMLNSRARREETNQGATRLQPAAIVGPYAPVT